MRGSFILALVLGFLPLFVDAASAPRTLGDLANQITVILSSGTSLLVLLGIVVYFWGIAYNILRFGEGDMEVFRLYFFWGIIVIFMMVSIWGIVGVLQNSIFGGNPLSRGGGGTSGNCSQFGNCKSQ